eukprot:1385924-Alexandrium_andersonii.AAC.1
MSSSIAVEHAALWMVRLGGCAYEGRWQSQLGKKHHHATSLRERAVCRVHRPDHEHMRRTNTDGRIATGSA